MVRRFESDGDDEEANETELPFSPTHQPQPNPFLVMRRYWKSLLGWPLLVLVLVLAAALPPIFVARSDHREEEMNRAMTEAINTAEGFQNGINTAFIPVASLGLWVTGRPQFLDQIDNQSVELAESYDDGDSPFQVAARAALDLVPQLTGAVQRVGLAPHGTISTFFPILNLNMTRPYGANLFRDPRRRKGNLETVLGNQVYLEGPELSSTGGRILIIRFPIFYQASDCSCDGSTQTSNDVIFRTGKSFSSFEEVVASNTSVPSLFSYGKLADYPEKYGVTDGRRFPTEVVFQTKNDELPTMFCDVGADNGLMGVHLEDFGVESYNTSIEYLPRCRFFWGYTILVYNFDVLEERAVQGDPLVEAGFEFLLWKDGFDGERITIIKSPDFSTNYAEPLSTNITLPGQIWTLTVVPSNNQDWEGDDWKWQLAIAILGAFFLAFIAFAIVFFVVYRKQYLKNVAEEFSLVTSDAMVQKKRAEASEKAAIENEAVAKKFLSTMSHELRTPLNSILAVSELMVLSLPDTPRISTDSNSLIREESSNDIYENPFEVRDCRLIHDSARFLKQIVDDVLDFNKIEMGCLVISPNRFSPALALQSVARLAFPLIKDPSLYFRLNVDPLTPKTVTTDEHRFKQIIMNLASNAIKFIKEGGLTISLSTVCLSSLPLSSLCSISGSVSRRSLSHSPCYLQKWEDRLQKCPQDRLREIVRAHHEGGEGKGLFVYVDVEDTGPGMTNEQQRYLFKPYYQNNPKRDAEAGGSGLGLSICADLCKAMGGVIWATDPKREEGDRSTSERQRGGKGTSFRFLLPLLGAEGRVSPDLIESLLVVDGGNRDGSLDSSFCQVETSIEEELGQEEGRVEIEEIEHKTTSSIPSGSPSLRPSDSEGSAPMHSSSSLSPSSSSSSSSPPSSPPSSLLRVLLIDDSKLNRLVFVRVLKSLLPCEVDEAENGEDGIKMALEGKEERKEYNLVVCDLNMGEGKTGLEVGEELREGLGYPFVLALFTADVMLEFGEGERGLFEAVLYKPLSRESLIEFLVRFLDKKYFPKDFPPKQGKKKKKKGVGKNAVGMEGEGV